MENLCRASPTKVFVWYEQVGVTCDRQVPRAFLRRTSARDYSAVVFH
jgi:hypothetical protein